MEEERSDRPEQSGSKAGQVNKQQRRSYDANFKVMVINAAESTNNCQAAKKYGVTESHVRKWRAQKERLKNANSMRKAFRGPKSGRFREIDRRVCEYILFIFFPKWYLKNRGRLIIRLVLYSGQYGKLQMNLI